MTHKILQGTLFSDVASAGTFTIGYPPNDPPEIGSTDEGTFFGAMRHKLVLGQNDVLVHPVDFDVTLGTANITITNKGAGTWPAGTDFRLELQQQGKAAFQDSSYPGGGTGQRMARMARSDTFIINLGAPDALVTNGICTAQSPSASGNMVIGGSLASGEEVTLDCPRNVVADSGGADDAVLTVYGEDEYGEPMVEALTLNGTTAVAGKKAFKKITRITNSKAIANGAFVGTGDVLGLPVFLPGTGHILKELENGTAASAGTAVAGLRTGGGSTATTADVRGTYDPNSACDGDKVFQLIVSLPDPGYRGVPQYAG